MSTGVPAIHRVVIVGGGAGGLPLATRLGDTLGRRGRAAITLVDRDETHVWKPLLHEVAAGRMDADAHDVDYLALAHWHRFRFRQGAVAGLDRARRELKLHAVHTPEGDEILPPRALPYDTLVIGVGSVSNDFGVPGIAEHAISLDTPREAERFHRLLLAACLRADARAGAGQSANVDIVIIGAGATGVELAAEIRQTTRAHAGYGLEHLDPVRNVRLTLVEAAPRILPPLSERIAVAATELLARLNVAVRTGWLSYVFATAELHRWHHARELPAASANYGTNLILWDMVFGTFRRPTRECEDVGLAGDVEFPDRYFQQIARPFTGVPARTRRAEASSRRQMRRSARSSRRRPRRRR